MDNWVGGGEPGNEPYDGGAPSYDFNYHIGLDLNAEVSSVQTNVDHGVPTSLLPPIFSSAGIHVRVVYTPDGLLEAFARANAPPFAEYQVLSRRIEPLSGPLLFGFTAATGGATATNEIDNLVVRAANSFYDATGEVAKVRIRLEKHIPAGGGLGGGSSDAAATLKALNELYDRPLSQHRLHALGSALGSDVPFFLARTPLALAWGRGERLLEPDLVGHGLLRLQVGEAERPRQPQLGVEDVVRVREEVVEGGHLEEVPVGDVHHAGSPECVSERGLGRGGADQ
jgi:hypothetical protein